jgi:epoxyqueuosine reductase
MSDPFPSWLTDCFRKSDVALWAVADLRGFETPQDESGERYPFAISFAIPMDPTIMAAIEKGPNQAYADEYTDANRRIDGLAQTLEASIKNHGFGANAINASVRSDKKNIRGDFPHKTAATRAGLGWIGRHCQLITRPYGPWVRLGSVFTNMCLPAGTAVERHFCGTCTRCVDACPASALNGAAWYPGLPREKILDVHVCDQWKKENYPRYHGGHNCGICSSVCPYGRKVLKRTSH